ncbi:MAG: L,D-transpeptidase family protein [Gemmatimonadaceae bacterium]
MSDPSAFAVDRDSLSNSIARRLRARAPAPGLSGGTWQRVGGLYSHRNFEALWLDANGGLSPAATALLQNLINADADGLRPGDYPLAALASALEALRAAPSMERASLADVLLSASFVMHAEQMLHGRLDQRSVESARHLAPRPVDVDSALTATLDHANGAAAEFTSALHRMRPQSAEYRELLVALGRQRELARRGGWGRIGRGSSLHPGGSSIRVPSIRKRLAAEGYLPAAVSMDTSETYDAQLASAVALFQARHGAEQDSIVGPRTQAALDVPVERRITQIEANLERLRWLPSRMGHRYLIVNIPAFRLDAFDGGQLAMSMNVVVGADYNNRGTPIFSDSMSYVVFAPYWNVPSSIASSELWPKQRRDRSYFRRNNYEVVNASWGTYVRQKPGPTNALGQVKFIFPNDFNVYLHDTPQKSLFAENVRAFSHGCIRVEKPDALARFVLGVQGWDSTAVENAMDGDKRTRVDLREKLPVYIVYLTAFVRDGNLTFRNDVYGYDAKIIAALQPRRQDNVGAVVAHLAQIAGVAS